MIAAAFGPDQMPLSKNRRLFGDLEPITNDEAYKNFYGSGDPMPAP